MGEKTAIEWADSTWNPIRARNKATGKVGWHCIHASPGCLGCYSEAMNLWVGTGLPFKPGHEKDIELFLDEEMLTDPLRWKGQHCVFVCSMTDLFADFVPDAWIDRAFAVMAQCPQHIFQVLTKRAERMRDHWRARPRAALANVWLGVSVEDQRRAAERLSVLALVPAAVRFASVEPLLEPVDLGRWLDGLDWVIVGGELGRGARPFDVAWARDVLRQCQGAGVPCFVKQLGDRPVEGGKPVRLRTHKGGDMAEWPLDLRVREFPGGAFDRR